jgi:ABC-2 type transport system ATP-binding protein
MDTVVEVAGLEKAYGHTKAVDGVTFSIREGEVFALLGPNGAGKTTTVEILEGYRSRASGAVSVVGVAPAAAGRTFRDRIGIVLQQSGIERDATVREALARLCRLYSAPADPADLMRMLGLDEKSEARIRTLSGGQRRRLDLAAALAGRPGLLFLDEPTTGFDPAARRDAWDLVRTVTSTGATVFLTTHYLDEAQHLADRVAVIADGRIVAHGDPSTLGGRDTAGARVVFRLAPSVVLPEVPGTVDRTGERVEIGTENPTGTLHRLTGWAIDTGVELAGLEVTRPSLEDVYLELIGEGR